MRTGPHKDLAATLTLFQPGGNRLCPPINLSFDSTGFASNSAKIWGGKCPSALMVSSALNIPHTQNQAPFLLLHIKMSTTQTGPNKLLYRTPAE